MDKKKLVLFLNHDPGVHVLEYLKDSEDILRVYVDDAQSPYIESICDIAQSKGIAIFTYSDFTQPRHQDEFKTLDIDFIICVYWPYLLKKDMFSCAKMGRVNFHPALLPINRGWFPHVHSILDGSPAGVTLHEIDDGADTGQIWAQKEVKIYAYETAYDVYIKLQQEIVSLFKANWPRIRDLSLQTIPQKSGGNYHKKSEIEHIDEVDLNKTYTGAELINLLRARSFGKRGFAYFEQDGERVYLNLSLGTDSDFSRD